jgi:hypothetical protein
VSYSVRQIQLPIQTPCIVTDMWQYITVGVHYIRTTKQLVISVEYVALVFRIEEYARNQREADSKQNLTTSKIEATCYSETMVDFQRAYMSLCTSIHLHETRPMYRCTEAYLPNHNAQQSRYWLNDRVIEVRVLAGSRIFFQIGSVRLPSLLYNGYRGLFLRG